MRDSEEGLSSIDVELFKDRVEQYAQRCRNGSRIALPGFEVNRMIINCSRLRMQSPSFSGEDLGILFTDARTIMETELGYEYETLGIWVKEDYSEGTQFRNNDPPF